jgi:hypothetical protein
VELVEKILDRIKAVWRGITVLFTQLQHLVVQVAVDREQEEQVLVALLN